MLAHVRYVADPAGGDPIAFLIEVLRQPGTWLAFGGGLVVLGVLIALVRVQRPLADNWSRFADRAWTYRAFVPWMLRLSAGLVLIGAGITGRAFAPDTTIAGWPTLLLTAIGFLLLLGFAVRVAAVAGLGLYAVALAMEPHLVEILDVAGALGAIAFLGPGVPSLDDLARAAFPSAPGARLATRGRPEARYEDVVPLLVRLGLGGAFLASGIVDKLLVPGQALATVERYGLTALVPVDAALWVVGAAAVETALGLAIVLGLFTRPAAILGFAVLTATLFGLPDDPVVAHVGLFGLSSVLVVLGPGRWSLDRRVGLSQPARPG
ncbi:MAG: DoxX family protein [Chloroflexi bacterium]|nr:DoxX family protein [Chloroflexota bacterium]